VLDTLIERIKLYSYTNVYLYIFTKTEFTNSCMDKAKELENIKLVTFDEMMK
jgi:hypothetical protein